MAEKIKKWVAFSLLAVLCTLAGARIWAASLLPDTFYLMEGETLTIANLPFLSSKQKSGEVPAASAQVGSSYNVELRLMGVLPVKTVRAEVSDRRKVTVCGTPFGIKMFSDGVMVVGFTDIYTGAGYKNPAKAAGLELGDYVISVNGQKVKSNEDLKAIVTESKGAALTVRYTRKGKTHTAKLIPAEDHLSGGFRTGMWVRDSSAGIGTLTFIDTATGVFGGLGHSVTDVDTGESLTLSSGEIVPVTLSGAVAGTPGVPGELRGSFSGGLPFGSIRQNGETGVYGILYSLSLGGTVMETAVMQEVKTGPAKVITTIDDRGPRAYDIEIERLAFNAEDPNKNMLIKVTDKELLAATGGIVQGMSGSPIIQNDRLVGAVTHVLVKDPTRGFGIFSENMLKTADSVKSTEVRKSA